MREIAEFCGVIPVVSATDIKRTRDFYAAHLGFSEVIAADGYIGLRRDRVEIHFWHNPAHDPARSEAFRVSVSEIDALYEYCRLAGIVHPNGQLQTKPWGRREFAVTDPDNYCITFTETA